MAKKLMVLEEGFARKATVVEVDVLEDSEVLLRILASRQRLDGIMDDIVDCRFGDLVLAALIAAEDRAAKLAKEKALKREAEAAQEAA